jgi:hypothetical protein
MVSMRCSLEERVHEFDTLFQMSQVIQKLVGVWVGKGVGVYPPRVAEFHYVEELTIKQTAKPIVFEFRSITKHAKSGEPMHVEVGFIRCPPRAPVEIVSSHPFGLTEISQGALQSDFKLELTSSEQNGSITRVRSATDPHTTGIRRVYELSQDGNELLFTMDMATSLHPDMQNHLICKLKKQ